VVGFVIFGAVDSLAINEKDVRAMVRLLGDTAAVSGGHSEKKRFLMDGLCQLCDCDAWAWALGCQITPGGHQTYVNVSYGGFDEAGYARLMQAIEHPDMGIMAEPFFRALSVTEGVVAMTQAQMDPENKLASSGSAELWQKADVGAVMMCGSPVDAQSLSTIGLYRRSGHEHFDERERMIAHIILSEVKWLHLVGWPEDRGATVPQLYPRQRLVLNYLLDGMIRKEIADHMGISENTVSGYIKEVYKHFGVNSHVELMKKFLHAAGA
jgi:DNA-binding CsgD family transcriptional regulator